MKKLAKRQKTLQNQNVGEEMNKNTERNRQMSGKQGESRRGSLSGNSGGNQGKKGEKMAENVFLCEKICLCHLFVVILRA